MVNHTDSLMADESWLVMVHMLVKDGWQTLMLSQTFPDYNHTQPTTDINSCGSWPRRTVAVSKFKASKRNMDLCFWGWLTIALCSTVQVYAWMCSWDYEGNLTTVISSYWALMAGWTSIAIASRQLLTGDHVFILDPIGFVCELHSVYTIIQTMVWSSTKNGDSLHNYHIHNEYRYSHASISLHTLIDIPT